MKPEYEPKTREQILGYLVEECGEVLAATGKTLRWGDESRDPSIAEVYCRECGLIPVFGDDTGALHAAYGRRHNIAEHPFEDSRETNREWILRELRDLEGAISRVRKLYAAREGR